MYQESQDEIHKKINDISFDNSLVEYIELLDQIDESKPIAVLNEISIIDNKGGRIYF